MNRLKRHLLLLVVVAPAISYAQEITLSEAIETARKQSVAALEAKSSFVSSYWAWRSYVASRLPALSIYGEIGGFNRSLNLLQSYQTGEMLYVSSYNMQNSVGLALTQNVLPTGGVISVYSDLSRIDQFGEAANQTWYSQPLTFSYSQPIFGFNQFKWDKIIAPEEYELAKRRYLEAMEALTARVVSSFYNLASARMSLADAEQNYADTGRMLQIAKERMNLGNITKDEYLQLELRMLNDSIAINESRVAVRSAQMVFNSLLGFDEKYDVTAVVEDSLPDVYIDYDTVLDKAMSNSSFPISNDLSIHNAEQSIARAKANRGITMSLNARFGLTKSAPEFAGAYISPLDQEVIGLSFSIPVFDWGLGRGRIKKAEAYADVIRAQNAQSENDYRRSVFTAVSQFNNQKQQCVVSSRAGDIAEERYELIMEKFRKGASSVTELNTARSEKDNARLKYIEDLRNYWDYYYTLRQISLYDFILGQDIEVSYEEMVE